MWTKWNHPFCLSPSFSYGFWSDFTGPTKTDYGILCQRLSVLSHAYLETPIKYNLSAGEKCYPHSMEYNSAEFSPVILHIAFCRTNMRKISCPLFTLNSRKLRVHLVLFFPALYNKQLETFFSSNFSHVCMVSQPSSRYPNAQTHWGYDFVNGTFSG